MTIEIHGETYLSQKEALVYLSVTKPTLHRLVTEKRLRQYKQGIRQSVYYRKADLDNILELREVEMEGNND